jgi:hypothetical protein
LRHGERKLRLVFGGLRSQVSTAGGIDQYGLKIARWKDESGGLRREIGLAGAAVWPTITICHGIILCEWV